MQKDSLSFLTGSTSDRNPIAIADWRELLLSEDHFLVIVVKGNIQWNMWYSPFVCCDSSRITAARSATSYPVCSRIFGSNEAKDRRYSETHTSWVFPQFSVLSKT